MKMHQWFSSLQLSTAALLMLGTNAIEATVMNGRITHIAAKGSTLFAK